jgi:hypothetical protein
MTQAELRQFVLAYKEVNPCTDCGKHLAYWFMEFDHVRGKKLFNLGSVGFGQQNVRPEHGGFKRLTLELVQTEIAKCELVCIWCSKVRLRGDKATPLTSKVRWLVS